MNEWDQLETVPDAQVLGALNYGPVVGEHHHDAMFGPMGNPLDWYDVAVSPDTGLQLGDVIKARGKHYTVADWSYHEPGVPTSGKIEFRDAPADGKIIVERVGRKKLSRTGEDWSQLEGVEPEVRRATLALTPTEEKTLVAPEGSPMAQDAANARPLFGSQIPSKFAKPENVQEVVARSIPQFAPDDIKMIPRSDEPIGAASLDEAFKTGGLLGAGAYIGQMNELPYSREAARLFFKSNPLFAPFQMAMAFPNSPAGQIASGLEDSWVDQVAQLSAPANLALIASGQALPGTLGKVATGWFLGQMARQFPEQYKAFREAKTLAEKTRLLGDMAGTAGIIYAGAKDFIPKRRPSQAGIVGFVKYAKEKADALKSSDAQIQTGEAPLREQVGTGREESQTSDSDKTVRGTEGTPAGGVPQETQEVRTEQAGQLEEKPKTYFKGDQAEYTGNVVKKHGGTFYEVTMLEGSDKGKTKVVVNPPKLRPGEKSTGELFQGEDQPFNLAGEEGIDTEAQAAEADAAAEALRASQEEAEQAQTTFDDWSDFEEPSAEEKRRLEDEYHISLMQDFEEHQARGGEELGDLLKQHGLKTIGAGEKYSGELNRLREAFRTKRGKSKLISGDRSFTYLDVFKKNGISLDQFHDLLKSKGFPVETISDTLDLIEKRFSGKKIFGDEAKAEEDQGYQYGMGAAHAREPLRPDEPVAQQLAQMIAEIPDGDPLSFSEKLAEARGRAAGALRKSAAHTADVVKSLAAGFKRNVWDAPVVSNFDRIKGRWDAAMQHADYWITELGRQLTRSVPRADRQEAIYNWAAADGDEATLRQWITKAPGDVRKGYEDALTLTQDEQTIGNQIRSAYDDWFNQAVENGMLEAGVENYLKRIVGLRPEAAQDMLARIGTGKFSTNFKEAKHRFWNEMVDAERSGIRYIKKLQTTSLYAQSFEHAVLNRKFKRQLFNMDVANGRPAMIVEGNGIAIDGQPTDALLVVPFGKRNVRGANDLAEQLKIKHPTWSDAHALHVAKEQILAEYVDFDHPAFKNWQWVYKDPKSGRETFVRGNAKVHKSIANKMENAFVQERIQWAEPLLRAQGFVKGSKLSLSLFHQVHEIANAFGHLTKIYNLRPLGEYLKDPKIQTGMEAGLKLVGSAHEQAYFAEGAGSHGWPELVPGLGKYVRAYKDFLFTDYIPRLKAEAYLKAYDRNVAGGFTGLRRTKNLTPEQNAVLTARQINASFGELNYRQMMRDPRIQQTLQGLFLAPDFGEAKLRHIGQLFTRYGGEQRMSAGLVAATLWFGSRALNQAFSGNPQWDKPFGVVIGDRQYSLRSLPGDMYHLFTDPRSYSVHRISPAFQNTVEALFHRDMQGNVVDWSRVLYDAVESSVPIPLTARKGLSWKDNLATAIGITPMPYRYETEIQKQISNWRKKSGDPKLVREQERRASSPPLPSMYAPLRDALRNGNLPRARDEYQKLLKGGSNKGSIETAMRRYSEGILTGSRSTDDRFKRTLDKYNRELFNKAVRERKFIYGQFRAMMQGATYHIYPDHMERP